MSFSNDDRLKPMNPDSFENLNFNNANYDYNSLKNKPTLNGITLTGDMMPEDLGLVECVEKWTFDFAECCIFPYVQDCVEAACCYVDCCISCMREDLDCCIQEECCFVIDTAAELSCCISCVREDLECCITDVDACLTCCITDVDTCLSCCINDVNSTLTCCINDVNSSLACCINDVNCALSCKIDSLPCGVVPIGTIPFCNLPALADVDIGWMYNISDDFETDNRFVKPGICMLAGSNVYVTESCCYDVFAAGNPIVVDQAFCPASSNAASGCAVNEALQCAYCCASDVCCCLEQCIGDVCCCLSQCIGDVCCCLEQCIGDVCCCLEQCIACEACDKLPYLTCLPGECCDGQAAMYVGADNPGQSGCWEDTAWNCCVNTGIAVWTDGTNTYYSSCSKQYKLDKDTGCWEDVSWNCDIACGTYIWTDGTDIYYSYYTDNYKLDKDACCWAPAVTNCCINGSIIWTDGTDVYYSYATSQYKFDKVTGCWNDITWNCCIYYSSCVWTDGCCTYYSCNACQYVLDKGTGCWEDKVWNCSLPMGSNTWTDGTNIYYDDTLNNCHLKLNKSTGCWEDHVWNCSVDRGAYTWTDGVDIYYSCIGCQYKLNKQVEGYRKGHTYQKCSGVWQDITPVQAVDQCFDPVSTNAQSGAAVAEAVCCSLVCNILCCNPSVADIAAFPDGFMWLETN